MRLRSVRVATIAGIPIGISPWWLLIVVLISWFLGASYFPDNVHDIRPVAAYAMGLASALLLFAGVLAHEIGHAVVARRYGIEVEEIDLWLLGGVAKLRGEAHVPQHELRYALAGPAVTGVIVLVLAIVIGATGVSVHSPGGALLAYQLLINGLILVFNLLPAFPLDGGRVLRALLWRRTGDIVRATATASRIGRSVGYGLLVLGGIEVIAGGAGGLWLVLVGAFLVFSASAQEAATEAKAVVAGLSADELMSTPAVALPAGISVAEAIVDYCARYRYSAFPAVDDDGRHVGLVTLAAIGRVAAGERERRTVGELADPDPALTLAEADDVTALLDRPAFGATGRAVVLDDERRPVGIVSVTDLQRAVRSARLARGQPARRW